MANDVVSGYLAFKANNTVNDVAPRLSSNIGVPAPGGKRAAASFMLSRILENIC